MMHPDPDLDRLQAYLDGTLTADESLSVEARLKADATLAEKVVRLGREEAVLVEWARAGRAADAICRVPLTPPPRRVRRWMLPAAAVVVLALALGVLLLSIPRNREEVAVPVAKLEEVQ